MKLVHDNLVPRLAFPYAERIALQEDCESVFGFHGTVASICEKGGMYWEQDVSYDDVLSYCALHGVDLRDGRHGVKSHGPEEERSKAAELVEKAFLLHGLSLDEVKLRRSAKAVIRARKEIETMAFFATRCTYADIADLVDRSPGQVLSEIHDEWCYGYGFGAIENMCLDAFHGLLSFLTGGEYGDSFLKEVKLSWYDADFFGGYRLNDTHRVTFG